MKTSTWIFISIMATALVAGGCAETFLVGKDGKGYFLGSTNQRTYDRLCASGDLEKVVADTQLSEEMKDELYRYNCSEDRSSDKVKKLYASMTKVQRKDIKNAFKANGYDINYLPCCGDSINSTSGTL
jgi:hypothetical protein